jgi:hypothetical protein
MSDNHYPPAYLRYVKAHLSTLAKPTVWGTAILLSATGLVIWQYWSNPNMLSYDQNSQVSSRAGDNSPLTPAEQAIAAELDSLQALSNDLEAGNIPLIATLPPPISQPNNNENSLLDEINKQLSSDSTAVSVPETNTFNNALPSPLKNPFIGEAERLLLSGAFSSNNQPLGINSLPVTSPPTSSVSGNGVNQTPNLVNGDAWMGSQTPQSELSNPGISANPINLSAPGVMQIPPQNGLPNPAISPNMGLNTLNGVQPLPVPQNLPPNSLNNFNNIPPLPPPVQPTMSGIETGGMNSNVSLDSPTPDFVSPMSPVVADRNGNLMWRSPSEQMQPNSAMQNMGTQENMIDLRDLDF